MSTSSWPSLLSGSVQSYVIPVPYNTNCIEDATRIIKYHNAMVTTQCGSFWMCVSKGVVRWLANLYDSSILLMIPPSFLQSFMSFLWALLTNILYSYLKNPWGELTTPPPLHASALPLLGDVFQLHMHMAMYCTLRLIDHRKCNACKKKLWSLQRSTMAACVTYLHTKMYSHAEIIGHVEKTFPEGAYVFCLPLKNPVQMQVLSTRSILKQMYSSAWTVVTMAKEIATHYVLSYNIIFIAIMNF